MKKLLLSCGIVALLCGIAAAIYLMLLPSKTVLAYDIGNDDRLYTISDYGYSTLLKISDKNGNTMVNSILDGRYTYQNICIGAEGVYLLAYNSSEAFVDCYTADGEYKSRVYSEKLEAADSNKFTLKRNYVFQDDTIISESEIKLIKITNSTEIFVDTIESTREKAKQNYVLNGTTASGALLFQDYLVYYDMDGNYYFINSDGVSEKMEFTDNSVLYNVFTSSAMLYYTDVSDISLKCLYIYEGEEGMNHTTYTTGITANTVFNGKTKFSELRELGYYSGENDSSVIVGVKKENGKSALFYKINAFDGMTTEYKEAGFKISFLIIVGAICFVVSFLVIFLLAAIIRRLLSVRKLIVKQIMLMLVVVLLLFFPIQQLMLYTFTSCALSFVSSSLVSPLRILLEDIEPAEYEKNGLTAEQRQTIANIETDAGSENISDWSGRINSLVKSDFSIEYVEIARLVADSYRYEYYTNVAPNALSSYFVDSSKLAKFKTMNGGDFIVTSSETLHRNWIEQTVFIGNENGEQIGFIQVGFEEQRVSDAVGAVSAIIAVIIDTLIIALAIIFTIILHRLLKPLQQLKKAVSEVSDGKIGTTVTVRSNDEFQDIGNSFNEMSVKLEKYFKSINVISKAYQKYLPAEFFTLMGKSNVMDIKPADRVNVNIAYIFVNINADGKKIDIVDSFEKLNAIYGIVNDTVSPDGGVIQSFDDNRITVIFTGGAKIAAETALTLVEKLSGSAFTISFTVQTAESVIGVIGNEEVLKCIAVSPSITLQNSIDEISAQYKLSFILTQSAMDEIGENRFLCRRIGKMSAFAANYAEDNDTMLYEELDVLDKDERVKKHTTLNDFAQALDYFEKEEYHKSRNYFISVLRVNRDDLVARRYLAKIDERTADDYERL